MVSPTMGVLGRFADWAMGNETRHERLVNRTKLTIRSCFFLGFMELYQFSCPPGSDVNVLVEQRFRVEFPEAWAGLGMLGPCDAWRAYKAWRRWDGVSGDVETFLGMDVTALMASDIIQGGLEVGPGEVQLVDPPGQQFVQYSGDVVLDVQPFQEKQHRRVRRRAEMPYARLVLSEVRARFGVPVRSTANMLAVRRYAREIMSKHGVRPSHMEKLIPYVCAAAFIPSDDELMAAEWWNCEAAQARVRRHAELVPAPRC